MSGGFSVLDYDVVSELVQGASFKVDLAPDLVPAVTTLIIRLSQAAIDEARGSDAHYSTVLDSRIEDRFGEEVAADPALLLEELSEIVDAPQKSHLALVAALSGVKQLSKLTILPSISQAFLLDLGSPKVDPVGYLVKLDFSEDQAAELHASTDFRDVMAEIFFFAFCFVVGSHSGEVAVPFEDPFEFPEEDPLPRSAGMTVELAELQRQFADMMAMQTKLVASMANLQAPPTAPLARAARPSEKGVRPRATILAAPLRGSVRALIPPPPEGDDASFDSDEDFDKPTLSQFSAAASQRGLFQQGVASMQGKLPDVSTPKSNSVVAPLSNPAACAFQGPLLQMALDKARSTFGKDTELSSDELLGLLLSPDGLLLLSVDGVPCTVVVVQSTKRAPLLINKIVTTRFNPDNSVELGQLGSGAVCSHLYPVSADQFNALINDQIVRAVFAEKLFGENFDFRKLTMALVNYRDKVFTLCDKHLGGHTDAIINMNGRHVTIFAVIMRMHINTWMRALLHGDVKLLLKEFDARWQSQYVFELGSDSAGLPLAPLGPALLQLLYRCPSCKRLGESVISCTSESCLTTSAKHMSSTTDDSEFQAIYQPWKKTQLAASPKKDGSATAFFRTALAKSHNLTAASTKATKAGAHATANQQQLIVMHQCPNYKVY